MRRLFAELVAQHLKRRAVRGERLAIGTHATAGLDLSDKLIELHAHARFKKCAHPNGRAERKRTRSADEFLPGFGVPPQERTRTVAVRAVFPRERIERGNNG